MINIPGLKYNSGENFLLIAGPCVVENRNILFEVAETLKEVCDNNKVPLILKASYRKANRSRIDSYTGPGDEKALEILAEAGKEFKLPVVTDIHNPDEAAIAARYADVLQIPAFLCRQTDLLIAAGETGKWINIKKGQFLSGESMKFAVEKVKSTGNNRILLTDRGNMYGYYDLVVDMRNIPIMKKNNVPIIVDITHSLQQPNQPEGVTGGQPGMIETIALAALAAGADGIFLETHPDPAKALSDGANMLHLNRVRELIEKMTMLRQTMNNINQNR